MMTNKQNAVEVVAGIRIEVGTELTYGGKPCKIAELVKSEDGTSVWLHFGGRSADIRTLPGMDYRFGK